MPEEAEPQKVGASQLRSSTGKSQSQGCLPPEPERPPQAKRTAVEEAQGMKVHSRVEERKGSKFAMAKAPSVDLMIGQGGGSQVR